MVLSLNLPVAVKLSLVLGAIETFAGATEIDCNVARVTFRVVEPLSPPALAVIVVIPMP